MEYISEASYAYIMGKFKTTPHARFVRNDSLFREDSGMAAADIMEGIRKQDSERTEQSHPVRKARAYA